MNFNYIFFDTADSNTRQINTNGYYYTCTKDLRSLDNVCLVTFPVDYAPTIVRYLFSIHHTPKINRIIRFPFKQKWYPYYFKMPFDEQSNLCFVISGTYLSIEYIRYLKKIYPNAKFVKLYRDLVSRQRINHPEFTERVLHELFDICFTYDANEARKYGMIQFDEFESKISIEKALDYPLCDIFFAGAAKDRLPLLIEIYDKLTSYGLNCRYYITGTKTEQRVSRDGIEYSNTQLSYKEMLYRSINAGCILEVNQEGAVGYTSRFLEAVMYNKKLVTNNSSIKNSKFYDPKFIQCFDTASDIDKDFIINDIGQIDYHYANEFSPVHLIEQIDIEMTKLERKRRT